MKSKIIALGDSIIKGVVLNIEENGKMHYVLTNNTIVDQMANKMHLEAVNLGKMGCTIETGERILDRHLALMNDAKYALLCFGGNDSDYNWRAIATHPKGEHHPKTPIALFEKIYARIIDKVRTAGVTPIVMTLPEMDAERYYAFITSVFSYEEKRNIERWLKRGVEAIEAGHELYNDAVKRVAAAADVQLLDISKAFDNKSECLCIDGIHPTCYGQKMMGKWV